MSNTGFNFRMDPNTGLLVDGNNGHATPAPGVNPDGPVSGATVSAAAYTNKAPGATAETLYTLDGAAGKLYIQNDPLTGRQTNAVTLTLNGAPVTFSAAAGFAIPPGVKVAASNDAAAGIGYAVLTINGTTSLYDVGLSGGVLTPFSPVVDGGTVAVQGFALAAGGLQVFGEDAGGGTVNAFNADGSLRYSLQPYGAGWTGGVRVASADVTGDGVADVITAAGPGGGPHVKVYDGLSGQVVDSFYAYTPSSTWACTWRRRTWTATAGRTS